MKFYLNFRDFKEDDVLSDQAIADRATTDNKLDLIFTKSYDYRLFTSELKRLSSKEFLVNIVWLDFKTFFIINFKWFMCQVLPSIFAKFFERVIQ